MHTLIKIKSDIQCRRNNLRSMGGGSSNLSYLFRNDGH